MMAIKSKALCAAVTLALSPLTALATEQILFPAYLSPDGGATYWNRLASSVSPQVPITMILNPSSGPSTDDQAFYTSFIPTFQSNGGRVIGYVDSLTNPISGPQEPQTLAAMEAQVSQYKTLYPSISGINGIFIDDFNYSSHSTVSFYQPLYNYIKFVNPNWLVYINPGSPIDSVYKPVADVIVSFEDTSANYQSYEPEAWQSSYPASDFGNIAYSEPTVASMQSDFQRAESDNAGYVYFSDYGSDTVYQNIPTNWSTELADVAAANAATPTKATYLLVDAGDFNTAANWSTMIPNAIGAEADFTGSLNSSAAAITSATAITLGKIVFNNSSSSFTLGGGVSLTMQVSSGSAVIDSQAGTHTVSLPMNISSNSIFQAEHGATLLITGPVNINPNVSLLSSGPGTVLYQSSVTVGNGSSFQLSSGSHMAGLSLNGISHASINTQTALPTVALEVSSLAIATGSTLDLHNGELIVNNGNLATLTAEVKSAYTNGLWTGTGITSSSASSNATHLTALGTIQNSVTGTPSGAAIYSSFGSLPSVNTDVLIKYTYYGDADLDGKVDGSDYSRVDNGFSSHLTGWYNGDFNYDGVVNGSDYALIDNAFNTQSAAITSQVVQVTAQVAAVPEPTGVLPISAILALMRRRRRRANRPGRIQIG